MGRGRRTAIEFEAIPYALREKIVKAFNDNPDLPCYELARLVKCQTYMVRSVLRVVAKDKLKRTSNSVLDPHLEEIRRLWDEEHLSKTKIAEMYGVSVGFASKYMLEHGISNEERLEVNALWDKTIEEVLAKNPFCTKKKKTDLESLGLKVVFDGKEYYDVSEFYGIGSPKQMEVPEWKKKLQALGIVNYGAEYGKFGKEAHRRNQFYIQNSVKLAKGEY